MNRTVARSILRRRLDDNLSGSGQVYADATLNEELNEAIMDVACDVELAGAFWRLAARHSFTLTVGTLEYDISALTLPFLAPRKLVRTDLSEPVKCQRVEFEDIEDYANTDGLADDDGFYYAIGPGSGTTGPMSIWLPVAPRVAATMVLHYVRVPTVLNHDTSDSGSNVTSPPDIPEPFHRLVPLKAAMNLLGPDQDGGGAWKAVAAEYGEMRERAMNLLARTYTDEFVRNVEGW